MKLKKLISGLFAGAFVFSFTASYIPETIYAESDTETETYLIDWVADEGTYTLTNDTAEVIKSSGYPALKLDISSITDWSVDYLITAEVSCEKGTGGAFVCFHQEGCDHENKYWDQGADLSIGTEPKSISFDTDGRKLKELTFIPWEIPADSTLTVSNIKIEVITEEAEKDEWTEENGVWSYTNTLDRKAECYKDFSALQLDISSVKDWSEIQYITAEIWTESDLVSNFETGYPDDVYAWFEYSTPDLSYGQSRNINATSTYDGKTRVKTVIDLPTNGETINWLNFMPYIIESGVTIHFENLTFHTEKYDEKLFTEQKWVQLDDGTWYYGHMYCWAGGAVNEKDSTIYLDDLLPEGVEWSDIQSITLDIKTGQYGGALMIKGTKENGTEYSSNISSSTDTPITITRNIRGQIVSDGRLVASWMGRGNALYISNIKLNTEAVPEVPIEPNDILIDESEINIGDWDNSLIIDYQTFGLMQTTGVLKIYTEPDKSAQKGSYYQLGFNDSTLWDQGSDVSWSDTDPELIPEDGIIRIEIDEEMLEKFRKSSVTIMGQYYKYVKMVFSPDPDSAPPAAEELKPDDTKKQELDKEFENNKHHVKHEHEGPRKSSDMEYKKLYIQRSGKKDYKGKKTYALRFVQKMKLSELENVKNTTMVINVDGKYVELTTDSYYNKVSIDGLEITCDKDEAFIVFIIDNIPDGKEISFSEFRFNK